MRRSNLDEAPIILAAMAYRFASFAPSRSPLTLSRLDSRKPSVVAVKAELAVSRIRVAASAVVSFGVGSSLLLLLPSLAAEAGQLFTKNCAGCHAGGGNIVQRNATLKLDDLRDNNAASSEQIYNLIYSGKGKMPGYGVNCAPKGNCTFAARLSDDDINSLTKYVLEQAAEGWQQQ